METLILGDILRGIVIRPITATQVVDLGSSAVQVGTGYERPKYHFVVRLYDHLREDMDELLAFKRYHRSDRTFWFDAWPSYSQPVTPQFVARGDGSQTQFLLPVRNVFPLTVRAFVNNVEQSITVNSTSGMITFSSAPANNAEIRAIWRSLFRCTFLEDAINFEEVLRGNVYGLEMQLRELPVGVSLSGFGKETHAEESELALSDFLGGNVP